MCVYGISRGKIDAAIQKIRACTGSIDVDVMNLVIKWMKFAMQ